MRYPTILPLLGDLRGMGETSAAINRQLHLHRCQGAHGAWCIVCGMLYNWSDRAEPINDLFAGMHMYCDISVTFSASVAG